MTLSKIKPTIVYRPNGTNPIRLEKIPLHQLHKLEEEQHRFHNIETDQINDTAHMLSSAI